MDIIYLQRSRSSISIYLHRDGCCMFTEEPLSYFSSYPMYVPQKCRFVKRFSSEKGRRLGSRKNRFPILITRRPSECFGIQVFSKALSPGHPCQGCGQGCPGNEKFLFHSTRIATILSLGNDILQGFAIFSGLFRTRHHDEFPEKNTFPSIKKLTERFLLFIFTWY